MKPTGPNVTWTARWIWSPGTTRRPFHVSYFRKEFKLASACARARIHCAADSKYRLWVNGRYLGLGPARGHRHHPYYDTHVVSLKAGRNLICFMVQHYTEPCAIFDSVRGGLICQVRAGGAVAAATDRSWRALSSAAYQALPGMIFPEYFDARAEPACWHRPGFNAGRWPWARVLVRSRLALPRDLLPRPIPLIREKRLAPVRLLDIWRCPQLDRTLLKNKAVADSLWQVQQQRPAPGPVPGLPDAPGAWTGRPLPLNIGAGQAVCLVLDFGKEVLASPEIAASGPAAAGILVDFGYSECLENDHVATRWQGLRQSERLVLRNGRTRHRLNQPRGFRFMILRIANPGRSRRRVRLEDLAVHEAVYPARQQGKFNCSDPLLDRIFALSARTVNLCMEDAYTDCPWRERSQWVGDAQPETLFSYYCFNAYDLARKAVLEFTQGNTREGWIPGVFPTGKPSNLPTWGMRVPVIAWEYYLYSGDRSALPILYRGVARQMAWFARYEDRSGLLVNMPGWCFVDWTKLDAWHNDGAVQGWYLEALHYSARLAEETGDLKAAAGYCRKAARLQKTLARCYWSPQRRAFLKYRPASDRRPPGLPPDLVGQHENFLFSLLNVGTAAQRRQALDAMAGETGRYVPNLGDYQSSYGSGRQQGNTSAEPVIRIGTPFWSYYALLALLEDRRVDEALEYIRLGWGLMLENGATSCWEMWDRHTSLCHGWSAAPAMVLPAYVLGVKPLMPGFKRFKVLPCPGGLAWAKGRVPTPQGTIRVSWKIKNRTFNLDLTVPAGTTAVVCAPVPGPTAWRLVKVSGKRRPPAGPVRLPAGSHTLKWSEGINGKL